MNFKYSNRKGDGESVLVVAKDYKSALAEALEEKHDPREPVEVEIIDPHLGRVLRTIGRGAVKAAKLGARYTIRGVTTLGRIAAEEMARAYKQFKVEQLVRKCYSPNRIERTKARYKLSVEYPEIYRVCDFSPPSPHVVEVRVKGELPPRKKRVPELVEVYAKPID